MNAIQDRFNRFCIDFFCRGEPSGEALAAAREVRESGEHPWNLPEIGMVQATRDLTEAVRGLTAELRAGRGASVVDAKDGSNGSDHGGNGNDPV